MSQRISYIAFQEKIIKKPHSSAYKKWGFNFSLPYLPPEQGDWRANNSEGMITEWEGLSSHIKMGEPPSPDCIRSPITYPHKPDKENIEDIFCV
jgi:hypothetical protein